MQPGLSGERRPRIIHLSIESRMENAALIGTAVRGICSRLSSCHRHARSIESCVVEAVNNAIEHAYGLEEGHPVEVCISLDTERIVLEISDRGRSMGVFPKTGTDAVFGDRDRTPEGGMGLFIIRAIMDEVAYRTVEGRNILTMIKSLAPEKRAP